MTGGPRLTVPAGLALGAGLDWLLGDPHRWHPVAGFGRAATVLEQRTYRDHELAGLVHVLVSVGSMAALTRWLDRKLPPGGRFVFLALMIAVSLGGTSLRREAARMAELLRAGDLVAARDQLVSLCGRDPASLDAEGLTRATVESVAENTSDAIVGTLLWGAVSGSTGVVLHRTANTLDAMVGYRTDRYRRFGWAAARLDDAVNLVPARVTALLTVAVGPTVGGRVQDAWRAWRQDAARHPSPNAGPVEAAMAGALGCTLGGHLNRYGDHTDCRPSLGDGPPPTIDDIDRAVALSTRVGAAARMVAIALASCCIGRRSATSRERPLRTSPERPVRKGCS